MARQGFLAPALASGPCYGGVDIGSTIALGTAALPFVASGTS